MPEMVSRERLIEKLREARELLEYFQPMPGHGLPKNSVPARIERWMQEPLPTA